MDLPTYTSIWRIEKRLYKLYDLRLPMPVPIVTLGVCLGIALVWWALLSLLRVPSWTEPPWNVLWIVPPLVLTFLATRPVVEGKRLPELLLSQARYLLEARVYCRLAPEYEPEEITVVARVWHRDPAAGPLPVVAVRATRRQRRRKRAAAPVTGTRAAPPGVPTRHDSEPIAARAPHAAPPLPDIAPEPAGTGEPPAAIGPAAVEPAESAELTLRESVWDRATDAAEEPAERQDDLAAGPSGTAPEHADAAEEPGEQEEAAGRRSVWDHADRVAEEPEERAEPDKLVEAAEATEIAEPAEATRATREATGRETAAPVGTARTEWETEPEPAGAEPEPAPVVEVAEAGAPAWPRHRRPRIITHTKHEQHGHHEEAVADTGESGTPAAGTAAPRVVRAEPAPEPPEPEAIPHDEATPAVPAGTTEETPPAPAEEQSPSLVLRFARWLGWGLPREAKSDRGWSERAANVGEYVRILPSRRTVDEDAPVDPADELAAQEEREAGEWFARLHQSTGETPWQLSAHEAYTDSDTAAVPTAESIPDPEEPDPEPEPQAEKPTPRQRAEEIMAVAHPSEAAEWLPRTRPADDRATRERATPAASTAGETATGQAHPAPAKDWRSNTPSDARPRRQMHKAPWELPAPDRDNEQPTTGDTPSGTETGAARPATPSGAPQDGTEDSAEWVRLLPSRADHDQDAEPTPEPEPAATPDEPHQEAAPEPATEPEPEEPPRPDQRPATTPRPSDADGAHTESRPAPETEVPAASVDASSRPELRLDHGTGEQEAFARTLADPAEAAEPERAGGPPARQPEGERSDSRAVETAETAAAPATAEAAATVDHDGDVEADRSTAAPDTPAAPAEHDDGKRAAPERPNGHAAGDTHTDSTDQVEQVEQPAAAVPAAPAASGEPEPLATSATDHPVAPDEVPSTPAAPANADASNKPGLQLDHGTGEQEAFARALTDPAEPHHATTEEPPTRQPNTERPTAHAAEATSAATPTDDTPGAAAGPTARDRREPGTPEATDQGEQKLALAARPEHGAEASDPGTADDPVKPRLQLDHGTGEQDSFVGALEPQRDQTTEDAGNPEAPRPTLSDIEAAERAALLRRRQRIQPSTRGDAARHDTTRPAPTDPETSDARASARSGPDTADPTPATDASPHAYAGGNGDAAPAGTPAARPPHQPAEPADADESALNRSNRLARSMRSAPTGPYQRVDHATGTPATETSTSHPAEPATARDTDRAAPRRDPAAPPHAAPAVPAVENSDDRGLLSRMARGARELGRRLTPSHGMSPMSAEDPATAETPGGRHDLHIDHDTGEHETLAAASSPTQARAPRPEPEPDPDLETLRSMSQAVTRRDPHGEQPTDATGTPPGRRLGMAERIRAAREAEATREDPWSSSTTEADTPATTTRAEPTTPTASTPRSPASTAPATGGRETPSGPTRGWRRLARVVTGGSAAQRRPELTETEIARLRTRLEGTRRVVVLGCTGGAGQTLTSLVLGHTLAQYRDDRVVAVDLNPGRQGLSRRVRAETPETLTSLLANATDITGYLAMREYTSQAETGLEIVATLDDPYVQTLDDQDYADLARLLDRHYEITLLDPAATGVARTLPVADSLVLVAPASADAARAVAMTFEWLDGHGYAELRSRAIVVINGVSKRSLTSVTAAEQVAKGRCRAIVRVPWDEYVANTPDFLDITALRGTTRRAHAALAGVLAASLAVPGTPPEDDGSPDPTERAEARR